MSRWSCSRYLWRKFALTLIAVPALTGIAAFVVMTRDLEPVHPSLSTGSLPRLIPVRDFYASAAAEWGFQPSHDGSMIAWYAIDWKLTTVIRIRRVGESQPFLTLSGAEFGSFRWHDYLDEVIVFAEGRLWQINLREPAREQWVDITPRGLNNWRVVSTAFKPEDHLAVVSNDRDDAEPDLYTVRQDGGGKQLLALNDGNTIDWWLDKSNVPLLRADRVENNATRFFIRDNANDPWRVLTEAAARDQFSIAFTPQVGKPIYALSDRGRDRRALVIVDPRSGQEIVVAEDAKVDVKKVFTFGQRASAPDFITFESGYTRYQAFTRAGEAFLKLMLDGQNPVDFNILGVSSSGRFVTVARSWREQSWEYFLYDLKDVKATKIADFHFRGHKDALAETKPVWFKARDGMEIPAFLTLPRGVEPKMLPTIVAVHGGPAAQQIWEYDHDNQFLANRGYAILSVNFRGSTGYGKSFRASGYGQVGKAMQDDIVDAANWLVSQGIADKANMAVMGGSYGGYSAALAMTRDPGLFKVAIAEYAVTDIVYNMQNEPHRWGLHLDESRRYFGNPYNANDLAEMRERSPITHVKNVEGAILLTAGKEDSTIGFEETEEFERALRTLGKDVTAIYFEGEGHGYDRWQTKVKRARVIEDFLAKRLGGRSGGYDYAETAAEYLN
ncbi:S9 family peptidase [Sinorhizobium sp. RAC02]|uniref:alpha/beta hydrolase family protein n=1 Tax=Sinorhizobium sp. RAC02 TaxID=1842534 RepID=UPI000855F7E8|nr:S9 family peptidase [Sinorhizobium sp. RAC02]AOF93920.1 alpha/beta hydrolase fold family protein [Sinorhizobium sp. RAC02]